MLHDFLVRERQNIIGKCDAETVKLAGAKEISPTIREGWSIFFDQLVELLDAEGIVFTTEHGREESPETRAREQRQKNENEINIETSMLQPVALERGKEYRRLGYSLSDIVRGYGIVCQAITTAATELDIPISAAEFSRLNLSLDIAIAASVTEYEKLQVTEEKEGELDRLGRLAHELRNALSNAFLALELIETGNVGARNNTGKLLNRSLQSMKMLIDSALLTVRMNIEPVPHLEWLRVLDVIRDIEITSASEARTHEITLTMEIRPSLSVFADRQHLTSALSNITQNAIKFSHPGGKVILRAYLVGDRTNIEIEDECDGLPEAKLKALFKPYQQMNKNKSGLGLGLSISRRAIELSDGTITARNIPGGGCAFTINLPGRIESPMKF